MYSANSVHTLARETTCEIARFVGDFIGRFLVKPIKPSRWKNLTPRCEYSKGGVLSLARILIQERFQIRHIAD